MTHSNTKRIAKNTVFLYFRMLVIMGVNLYTVRVVLDVLGAEDYGIYYVIGGVVTMFSFLNSTLASSSQRFFSYELGRGDFRRLRELFSLNITMLLSFIVVLLIIAETAGLWFINTQLTIPSVKMEAANWVYQFAIFSFIASILTVPYHALIIAHEKMNAFAYISIAEAVVKLLIVFLLMLIPFDRLELYSVLLFFSSAIVTFSYYCYCRKNFSESRFRFFWNRERAVEFFSYSGWHFIGSVSVVVQNQGINILLNMFFNPVVNAARAIAYQVNVAINALAANFFVAVKPQIYKSYSTGKIDEMNFLVCQSTKFCFYLILFLAIPVYLEVSYILNLWLNKVPLYTVLFTKLAIINALIDSTNSPAIASALATGRIKKFELCTGILMIMNLPISYVFLKLGYLPQITFCISISISLLTVWIRVFILRNLTGLSVREYNLNVLWPMLKVVMTAFGIPFLLNQYMQEGTIRFFVVGIISLLSTFLAVWKFGLIDSERLMIRDFGKKYFKKITYK